MAHGRVCSECGTSLASRGPKATTCSARCRWARSRRLARQPDTPVENLTEAMSYLADQNVDQALARVTERELIPVVREAITEDVYRAIQSLIGLSPKVVARLEEDLDSPDDLVRQKAMALALKYTVGHPALTDKDTTSAGTQLTVSFALPRPDDASIVDATLADEDNPDRTCDLCGETKSADQFVGASDRCMPCVANWKRTIEEQYLTKS